MSRWWFVVAVVVVVACIESCRGGSNRNRSCPNLNSQRGFDLDQLMGKWYLVEVIQHQDTSPGNSGEIPSQMDTCSVLQMTRETVDRVQLFWEDKSGRSEYNFQIPVKNNPGHWLALGQPNGSLSEARHDIYYTETLQVIKGVGPQVVITLCSRREHQLTTLLLAKERNLDEEEAIGAKNMLIRRGLKVSREQATCKSKATIQTQPTSLLTLVLVLLGVIESRKVKLF